MFVHPIYHQTQDLPSSAPSESKPPTAALQLQPHVMSDKEPPSPKLGRDSLGRDKALDVRSALEGNRHINTQVSVFYDSHIELQTRIHRDEKLKKSAPEKEINWKFLIEKPLTKFHL